MDKHIVTRITALVEAIERRKMEQEAPVDDLSRSLFAFERELAGLNEAGRDALFEEWRASDEAEGVRPLSREAFDRFLADLTGV